jgi:hypothetical protein
VELEDIQARFCPNGAKFETGAWYFEKLAGITFIDNDAQLVAAVIGDGDFQPYLADVFANAAP